MPTPRYYVQGADARTAAALTPGAVVSPCSLTFGAVRIVGHPGDLPIRSPKPQATSGVLDPSIRTTQTSHQAPDYFLPSIYYTTPANMHPPLGLLRLNELPVPATDVYKWPAAGAAPSPTSRLPQPTSRRKKMGGRQAPRWPAAVQRWPALSTRYGKAAPPGTL